MKIYKDLIQGSDEWIELRSRKLTASHATAIASNGAGLKTYVSDIIETLIFGQSFKGSKDTERGHLLEPIARIKYEFETGRKVDEVGFVERCNYSGASPDGLIFGEKKGIEIKARNNKKHLALIRGGKISSSTIWQIQMSMLCTGFDRWDFVSYNKDFKKSILIREVKRDEAKIEKLIKGLDSGILMLKEALNDPAVKFELNDL